VTRRILTVIAGTLLAASSAAAQTPAPQPAPAAPPVAAPVEPQGFTYNPEGRRDPFVSLLRRGADTQRTPGEMRPAGIAGLETAEVTVKGIMQSRSGYVALVQGTDLKTYIVRSGDRLLDGTIQSITADAMVILQQVDDPLSVEKQREVRKLLRQTEEVK
jgi:Tfp pilus assembly protein PilP